MFGPRGGFARPEPVAPSCAPRPPAPPIVSVPPEIAPPIVAPPLPAPPIVPAPPVPAAPNPCGCVRLVDSLYSEIPGGEVGYLQREARVVFQQIARFDDGSGTILKYVVPSGQTLLVSDVSFFAQGPGAQPGDQSSIGDRRLMGYVTLHVLVDDRTPLDLHAEVDAPTGAMNRDVTQGSIFSRLGDVMGGAVRQPHLFLKAREGQVVRLAYTVVRAPVIPVEHVGGLLRGYIIPTAIAASKGL